MTFLLTHRGTGILPVGQTGVSPAVYSPTGSPRRIRPVAGKMPAGPIARMAVLLLL